jgi:hypothetical protein
VSESAKTRVPVNTTGGSKMGERMTLDEIAKELTSESEKTLVFEVLRTYPQVWVSKEDGVLMFHGIELNAKGREYLEKGKRRRNG